MRGVIGRIDHLAIDVMGGRLFVCALGSDAVEVLDLRGGSVAATISGLREPQGVVYLSDRNKLYVSNGGTGELDVFDGSTLRVATRIDLGSDADNLRYDPTARSLLVGAGHSLAVIDVSDDRVAGAVPLPGHPEGFALEQPGGRIFVNVPLPSRSVFVVDRKANAVSGRWPVGGLLSDTFSNFPLNVDESSRRVFVGTRVPASLKVLDESTGRIVTEEPIDGDPDDIFYDAQRRLVIVSCGKGFLDVFQQVDADHYRPAARVATAAGARTSLWVPEMDRLFVAAPRAGGRPAEILVYSMN